MKLESKVPSGDIAQKWDKHRFEMKLVNPANKRKFRVIVVGSDLPVRPQVQPWLSLATTWTVSATKTPSTRSLDCGPGRYQRSQELSKRRRQRISTLLRYR